jgi:CRP-like cAMP-binding protein
MSPKINIPSDIAKVLFKQKIFKPFLVFIYLKLNAPSSFNNPNAILKKGEILMGLTERTLRTHFNTLLKLKWIGQDQNGVYYLRSMDSIRRKLRLSDKNSILVNNKHLKTLDNLCIGAFLTLSVKRQQTVKWIYKNKRKKSRVAQKQLAANHRDEFFYEYNYFGMSSAGLANKLGISRSRAHRLMKGAHKLGYIKLKKKVKKLLSNVLSNEINCLKRSGLYENHKLLVRPSSRGLSFTFDLFLQLHNEIKPFLVLKRKGAWSDYDVLACGGLLM